jgi:alpha-beta hydrolase superfamily lysophospholipase
MTQKEGSTTHEDRIRSGGLEIFVRSWSGSQRFFDAAGSADKTLKLYDRHYHDLLNDVDRDVVMKDILAWIDARMASAGPGAARLDASKATSTPARV